MACSNITDSFSASNVFSYTLGTTDTDYISNIPITWETDWKNNYYQTYYDTSSNFLNYKKDEYLEFIATLLGLPSYEDFLNMSEAEKKAIIRNTTIDKVLNENK